MGRQRKTWCYLSFWCWWNFDSCKKSIFIFIFLLLLNKKWINLACNSRSPWIFKRIEEKSCHWICWRFWSLKTKRTTWRKWFFLPLFFSLMKNKIKFFFENKNFLVIELFDFGFAENGLTAYRKGVQLASQVYFLKFLKSFIYFF